MLLAAGVAFWAAPALADPCEAPVRGYKAGQTVSGTVLYVGDADSVCVALGRDPSTWLEIRLADFYGPELNSPGGRQGKAAMERLAFGKQAVCTVQRSDRGNHTYSYDRLIAVCRVGGTSLGDQMRRAGVQEGGNGRR